MAEALFLRVYAGHSLADLCRMELVDFHSLFQKIPEIAKMESGGGSDKKQGPPPGESLTGELGAGIMKQIIPKGKGEPPELVKQIFKEHKENNNGN